jgi:hypothetical protein
MKTPSPVLLEDVRILSANASMLWKDGRVALTTTDGGPIRLAFASQGHGVVLSREDNDWFVLSTRATEQPRVVGNSVAWALPVDVEADRTAWMIRAGVGVGIALTATTEGIQVTVEALSCDLLPFENRPRADVFGARFSIELPGGELLVKTLAAFYWGTLLPSVIERTAALAYPLSRGYVVSTLARGEYAGTYPDVDHEFQVKGRLALGNALDENVVRRMLELQFQLMREDPEGLWRDPCALQPNGVREYHVRRSSMDRKTNAEMFLLTGNVEVLESAWLYTAQSKNFAWLAGHIEDLEGAASCVEAVIDAYGRLWSDVYFEDQVMQDGRVCDAQAFAANGLRCLAELEACLGRDAQAGVYQAQRARLEAALIEPLPRGYWDGDKRRFINWVDRTSQVHDHKHLLSNILPVLFEIATEDQRRAVFNFVDENAAEFQRFPSFVAADIAAYTDSEIGDGGPYDLCAAGRYWCWDAAFWSWRKDRARLRSQLDQVARQAAREAYAMGERYDMDHVYYVDGSDWHGAALYYEYPCVFAWVLVHEFLGVRPSLTADWGIAPRLNAYGRVELTQARFELAYAYQPDGFSMRNLAAAPRTRSFEIDLSALYPQARSWRMRRGEREMAFDNGTQITLGAGEEIIIRPI